MGNYFESLRGKLLSEQVSNPNIRVGRYSYYSGYYHGHSFDDCARYLMPDRDDDGQAGHRQFLFDRQWRRLHHQAGNQGHRAGMGIDLPLPLHARRAGLRRRRERLPAAGDTLIGHDVWIGTEAMFMPGVRVGHGAIIGSRALVTGDVEALCHRRR